MFYEWVWDFCVESESQHLSFYLTCRTSVTSGFLSSKFSPLMGGSGALGWLWPVWLYLTLLSPRISFAQLSTGIPLRRDWLTRMKMVSRSFLPAWISPQTRFVFTIPRLTVPCGHDPWDYLGASSWSGNHLMRQEKKRRRKTAHRREKTWTRLSIKVGLTFKNLPRSIKSSDIQNRSLRRRSSRLSKLLWCQRILQGGGWKDTCPALDESAQGASELIENRLPQER